MAYKQQKFTTWSSRSWCWHGCIWRRKNPFLGYRLPASHCVLTWWEMPGISLKTLVKALIPVSRALPSWTKQGLPSNTIILCRFSTYIFWKDKSIYIICPLKRKKKLKTMVLRACWLSDILTYALLSLSINLFLLSSSFFFFFLFSLICLLVRIHQKNFTAH